MDKLSFEIVWQVVIAKELVSLEAKGKLILSTVNQRLLILVEANTDLATDDKVHFEDFFLFVINDFITLVWKTPGFKAEGHIM